MESIEYRKDLEYFIEMPGLASDSVGCVGLDGKYALIQVSPTYSLAVAPPIGQPRPPFKDLVFYANCLGYDHDLPVFIAPTHSAALRKPIEEGPPDYVSQSYYQSLAMAFEAVNAIRLGPLGYVEFRWPGFRQDVEIHYREKYSNVLQELSLYNTALKQVDPLSEFLSYYRVIESVSGNNGKEWVRANIRCLKDYHFGSLSFGSDTPVPGSRQQVDLFELYRRRATSRLLDLRKRLTDRDVADYFYNEIRCGIAHGKRDVKDYDYDHNVIEVAQDTYILKLLARVALEEKNRSNACA